jgi:8-oxo-dGTP diphosphatase
MKDEQLPRIRVAALCTDDAGKLLLISHKKGEEIYWLLPGGGVNYGETLTDALKREMLEELNISVRVGDIAFVLDSIDPQGSRHVVNINFYCTIEEGEPSVAIHPRLHSCGYFSPEDMSHLTFSPPVGDLLVETLKNENIIYNGARWKK